MKNGKLLVALTLLTAAALLAGCIQIVLPTAAPAATQSIAAPQTTVKPAATEPSAPTAMPEPTPAPEPTPTSGPKELTTGSFNGNVYTNDYFGLTFTIPDGYNVATKDEMASILQVSEDLLNESGDQLADEKDFYLTYVMKYPYGSQEGFNANMNAMCTNLGLSGLISGTTSEDCLKATQDQLNTSGLSYTFGDITAQKINGADYSVMDATLSYQGVDISQRIYCTIQKGYAFAFTLTWMDNSDLTDLETMMSTITFK